MCGRRAPQAREEHRESIDRGRGAGVPAARENRPRDQDEAFSVPFGSTAEIACFCSFTVTFGAISSVTN